MSSQETAIDLIAPFVARGCPTADRILQKRVRDSITDTIGCMIAGGKSDVVSRLVDSVSQFETGLVPVLGSGKSLSPAFAALANGTSAHAYDLDDWEVSGNTHPSAVLVPALLSAAAITPVDGKQFMQAYATGFEVIARIGETVSLEHYVRGHHSTATIGTLGAAAAVANLLQLNTVQCGNAIAISVSQASGYLEQFGSSTKALQAGFAAKGGFLSALFARQGLTGKPGVLDGKKGIFSILVDAPKTHLMPLSRIEKKSAIIEHGINLKLYPSCSCTHRLIDCARQINEQPDFDAATVKRITATLPDFHKAILPYAEPKSETEALFSLEFCIAHTLLGGTVSLNALEERAWENPDTRALASRIEVKTEAARRPHLSNDPDQPDHLEIECSGKNFGAECGHPPGSVGAPPSSDQLRSKFCAVTGFSDESFDIANRWLDAEDMLQHVEEVMEGPK